MIFEITKTTYTFVSDMPLGLVVSDGTAKLLNLYPSASGVPFYDQSMNK